MEIKELKERKRKLEMDICKNMQKLIDDFIKETMISPENILIKTTIHKKIHRIIPLHHTILLLL